MLAGAIGLAVIVAIGAGALWLFDVELGPLGELGTMLALPSLLASISVGLVILKILFIVVIFGVGFYLLKALALIKAIFRIGCKP